MNREIKFRGKELGTGEWRYGSLIIRTGIMDGIIIKKERCIIETIDEKGYGAVAEVDPKTVGQYIGLEDKNGSEIYDVDIIITDNEETVIVCYGKQTEDSQNGNVYGFYLCYKENYFERVKEYRGSSDSCLTWGDSIKIIGNIHDNPELLEKNNEQRD